jgi:conjugative transfer region lipoprotein (TIGR03751 family)
MLKKIMHAGLKEFKKLPNPELTLYVYSYFAAQDQVLVPGYFTGFSVYNHDYYDIAETE